MTVPCVNIDNLHKAFDGVTVLHGITAQVQPGEVIGLLGLNGAGKTTLLETLLGFCIPDGGHVQLFGHDSSRELDAPTRARIGFVPQRDELIDSMTGRQYLDLVAAFYPSWNRTLVERLTQEWNVPLTTKAQRLSVGQRQKLSILAALGHEPDLLVLDEPVASLDPLARRQFVKELVDISDSATRAILFSTHIVSDLERIASRVWLVKDGRIVLDAPLDTIKEQCVRVRVPAGTTLPATLPGLLHQRTEQGSTVLLFTAWDETGRASLDALGASIETLSLEDIFLELHA